MVKYVYIRVISLSNWAAKIWLYGGGNVAFKVVLVDDDLLVLQDLETLAYLPDLCDMVDGTLIFDEKNGELRSSPIYSLEELLTLAEKK